MVFNSLVPFQKLPVVKEVILDSNSTDRLGKEKKSTFILDTSNGETLFLAPVLHFITNFSLYDPKFCVRNYSKILHLRTTNVSLTVSEGQEMWGGLAGS